MLDTMQARWHGAPVWVWAAGGTVLAAGAVYVYRKRAGSTASAATGDTTGQTADNSGGAPFPGAGNYLPPGSSNAADSAAQQGLLDQLTKAGGDIVDQLTKAGSSAVDAINGASSQGVQSITQAVTNAAPQLSQPPQPPVPVPSAVSSPIAPATNMPSVPGDIFSGLGLAPAPVGMTAVPIYASDNTVIGESFQGTSTFPTGSSDGKPWNVIDNPPPADQIKMTPNGPVTLAQWNILTPAQRGQ